MKSLETRITEQRQRVADAAERRRQAWDVSDSAGWVGMLKLCGCYNYHQAFKAWQLEVETLAMLERHAH